MIKTTRFIFPSISPRVLLLLVCLMLSNVLSAAGPVADEVKGKSVDADVKEKAVAPVIEILPDAPTIKDLADKQNSDNEALKKLAEVPVKGPKDDFNRSTPRSSLIGLALSAREGDFDRAVNYLDLRNLPFSHEKKRDGPELVRKLVVVAKRVMNIDFEEMSNDPLGHKDDGLPSYRDLVTTVQTKNGPVDILMQRVPRGDGVFIWKISNATVALIPALDAEFGYGVIGNKLSHIFPHYVIGGFEIWQIVMLIGLIIVAVFIAYVATFLIMKLLKVTNRFKNERLEKFIIGPLRFLIAVLIFRSTFDMIAPSLTARALFEAKTMLVFAVYWIMLGVIDVVLHRWADRMKRQGQNDAIVLLKPASTSLKLVITLIALLTWLDNLGFEVTALLAGLGVGGVAIALASQKSLENLIGSITIYTSRPVHVGDFCKFEDTLGVVEEIGLRATQLRTPSRTVVHIPNALFAAGKIENLTQRDKILYRTRLRLALSDTPDQIKQVLAKIRELIDQHKFIEEENSRVRFLEFGEYAQELELYVYIKTDQFTEYLEYREDINLKISDIIESVGVKLVVPAKTSYIKDSLEAPAS